MKVRHCSAACALVILLLPSLGYSQSMSLDGVATAPSFNDLLKHSGDVRAAYTNAVWVIDQVVGESHRSTRISWSGELVKIERLEGSDRNTSRFECFGDNIRFRGHANPSSSGFVLDMLEARKPSATNDPDFHNRVQPLSEAWAGPFLFSNLLSEDKANGVRISTAARNGVSVVRMSSVPKAAPSEQFIFDFRPDLGWVVDRIETNYVPEFKDRKRVPQLCKAVTTIFYDGTVNGVGRMKSFVLALGLASESNLEPEVTYEITDVAERRLSPNEFTPEAFGIKGIVKPAIKPPWWRWPAIIAGVAALGGGLWWWRRRAKA